MGDTKKSKINAPLKVLLVHPEYPSGYWNFKYALQLTDQKNVFPPLGLLTVASMLPKEWEKKLIDLNIEPLEDEHLKWADYVFIGAMDVQQKSATEVTSRCNKTGAKVVAGGPFFTEHHEDFENADHLILGEAEITLPRFLEDLEKGTPKHLYMPGEWPDLEKTPPPLWDIIDIDKYIHASMQYSRGCPFDCEFCQITKLFGRKVRTKNKNQIIQELESLYNKGWRGSVFFVDDNFIGNKHKLKTEILPAIIEWNEKRGYPFGFYTQASINLADDEELIRMMVRAGFDTVFLGIETVDDDCLAETGKFQNRNRDIVANVKKLQRSGLQVWGGFIVGFDSDKESIFDRMIKFIQESGITLATMGTLRAWRGSRLYERLKAENRLIHEDSGDNTDFTINFIPKMGKENLLRGHKKILKGIYSPEPYYQRIITFLKEYDLNNNSLIYRKKAKSNSLKNLVRIMVVLGILDEARFYYWKLIFWSLRRKPRLLKLAIILWLYGYHFRKIFRI